MLCLVLLGLEILFVSLDWPEERKSVCTLGLTAVPDSETDEPGYYSYVAEAVLCYWALKAVIIAYHVHLMVWIAILAIKLLRMAKHEDNNWDKWSSIPLFGLTCLGVASFLCCLLIGECYRTMIPQTVLQYPAFITIILALIIYLTLGLRYIYGRCCIPSPKEAHGGISLIPMGTPISSDMGDQLI